MKKNLYGFILTMVLASCNNDKDKKVAIDHLCKCINAISSLQKYTNELGRVLHKNAAIINNPGSQTQDILNAYDSLGVGQRTYKEHLDTVISELGAIEHIESKTQFQENSLRYLRNATKVVNVDFKAIYLAHKGNADQGNMDKYADLRKQIEIVSDMGDSIYLLRGKFAEEFKLSEDELATDCASQN